MTMSIHTSEDYNVIVISNMSSEGAFNPFGASPEELLAGTLAESGLINETTRINDRPALDFAQIFYQKRKNFKDATRLGDMLLRVGIISQDQLSEALVYQKQNPIPLGKILVELGYCNTEDLSQTLAHQQALRDEFEKAEHAQTRLKDLWGQFLTFFNHN